MSANNQEPRVNRRRPAGVYVSSEQILPADVWTEGGPVPRVYIIERLESPSCTVSRFEVADYEIAKLIADLKRQFNKHHKKE